MEKHHENVIKISGSEKILGGDAVFIIAEIGKNFIQTKEERSFEEYLKNSKELIDAAVYAGADAVKFQTHEVEDEQLNIAITSPHFSGSERYSWITRNMNATPLSFWREIKSYCDQKGIIFFSTPMSRKAAQKIAPLNLPLWKVGSGDIFDYVMLDFLIETKKPIIISTGMTSLEELDEVIEHIQKQSISLVILYCISKYPCPPEDFNLGTIEYFKEKYPDAVIGFSDHSIDGHNVDLAAIKLGARVIEKHFSFSRELWGSDHKASITPEEMKKMVMAIRAKEYKQIDVKPYYGVRDKELEGAHSQFRPYFNKALVASMDLPAGTILEREMVFAVRPKMYSKGLPAHKFYGILGKRLKKDLRKFNPILSDNLEEKEG